MNQDSKIKYEIYQWDKFCLKVSILFLTFLLLCITLVLCLLVTKKIEYSVINIIFSLLVMVFLIYIIHNEIKYLKIINKQNYIKLIYNKKNDTIELIDKSDNITRLKVKNLQSVKIEKIILNVGLIKIVTLGNIKFLNTNIEDYNIIISDIDDFIKNTGFQNVVKIKYI